MEHIIREIEDILEEGGMVSLEAQIQTPEVDIAGSQNDYERMYGFKEKLEIYILKKSCVRADLNCIVLTIREQ